MAVGKGREDDLEDPYELLDISEEAGDKEITAAYRKGSLKCHPDRNPDDPEAAEKFDRITRAKDLLLDPTRRAALDRQRKAKRELAERFSQEDSKRRKLREDLEFREGEASRNNGLSREELWKSRQELRKKQVQMDFNQRIRAKEADMAERQAKVVAEAQEVRAGSQDAQLHLTWRGPLPPSVDAVKAVLDNFELRSLELGEERGMATLASREDALQAVLYCRERRHQLPFRVVLATAAAKTGRAPGTTGTQPQSTSQPTAPPTAPETSSDQSVPTAATTLSNFDEWEASMLASLQGLAKKQHEKADGQMPSATDEEWETRIAKREKEVFTIKSLQSYKLYLASIPHDERGEEDPRTPDPRDRMVSKRTWKWNVENWRLQLKNRCSAGSTS